MSPVYPESPVFFKMEKNNKYIRWKIIKLIFLVGFRGKLHLQQACRRIRKARGREMRECQMSWRCNLQRENQTEEGEAGFFISSPNFWAVVFTALQVCYFPDPQSHADCSPLNDLTQEVSVGQCSPGLWHCTSPKALLTTELPHGSINADYSLGSLHKQFKTENMERGGKFEHSSVICR